MFDYSKTPFIVYYDIERKSWIPMRNGRFATYDEAKKLFDDLAYYMWQLDEGNDDEV